MTVRNWMLRNMDRYISIVDLVDSATQRFNYDVAPYWLWNEAQFVWDLRTEKKLENKYGR